MIPIHGPKESRGRPSGSSNDLLGIYACLKVECSADERSRRGPAEVVKGVIADLKTNI